MPEKYLRKQQHRRNQKRWGWIGKGQCKRNHAEDEEDGSVGK